MASVASTIHPSRGRPRSRIRAWSKIFVSGVTGEPLAGAARDQEQLLRDLIRANVRFGVKLRKPHCEQMFSAFRSERTLVGPCGRHSRKVPLSRRRVMSWGVRL